MESAWKVGLIVVVAVGLVIAGYQLVGERLFTEPVDIYYAEGPDVAGIQPGAAVSVAGVVIGRVQDVRLGDVGLARLTLAVRKGTKVPKGSYVEIPSSLISIGEQRVAIVPPESSTTLLSPGAVLDIRRETSLADVLKGSQDTIKELNQTLAATRELLSDPELKQGLKDVLRSTDKTIQTAGNLMAEVQGVVRENRKTVRQTLQEAAIAVASLKEGVQAVNSLLTDPRVQADARQMIETLAQTAKRADELVANLNALITDPELRTAIDNTLVNTERISQTGVGIAEDVKQMTADGKVVSAKAIEVAEKASQIADEAKTLLEKLNEFVDRLPSDIKLPKPFFSLESGFNGDRKEFQTDLLVGYPLRPGATLYGGVYDLTEANRLTLQYGQEYPNLTLRYGIFASKAGVGVDYRPWNWLGLTANVFDPNDFQFDFRARFLLGRDAYGWAGVNSLFGRNEPIVGFGVKR
jgi:phospholipid/cholesterol/gamma-HCH transport system substrate-binding protein